MKKNTHLSQKSSGFTMLEILLVVAAIAILAGIVIVAINPGKQLAETRDAKRNSNVNTILNAIYQYSIDNSGNLPGNIPTTGSCGDAGTEICATGTEPCGLVDLSALTDEELYLVTLPDDPLGPSGANPDGSGYHVVRTSNDRIVVCAPNTERTTMISIRR